MRILAVLLIGALCGGALAGETAQFSIKRDAPPTGSHLRETGAKAWLPFDKPYGELSAKQQAGIKARYEHMGEGDEPPYPLNGPKHIWKSLVDIGDRLDEHGTLRMVVDVDAAGKATRVAVLQSPGERLSKAMSVVLLQEPYKSALCAGTPCAQQFLFEADWVDQ